MNRRRFLELTAAAATAPLAVEKLLQDPRVLRVLQLNAYALDLETPLELLTDYLTPNSLFFVRHHWQPTIPDPATWRLRVEGEVERPLSLSLRDLERMPATSVTCVLQCAGNGRGTQDPAVPGIQWGHGAVGNAKWTGVRVKDVLERAGARGTARHLHTFGSDSPPGKVPPFHRSLELERMPDQALIAYRMNDERLPRLHGAPARLVVPGWAGDHWMKWLTRIALQPEPQKGFYMDVAYRYPRTPGAPGVTFRPDEMDPVTELLVKSSFATVPARVRPGRPVVLRGFAFSGAPDIARVEVSTDGGSTWQDAALDPRHDPFAWRRWSLRWTPAESGRVRLVARATDSRGRVQPEHSVWNQSGYLSNGWHTVEVEVGTSTNPSPGERPATLPAAGSRIPPLPDGDGRAVAQQSCLPCHSADVLRQQRLTERQWSASLTKMKGWGAELREEDQARLLTYLAQHFGPENRGFRPVAARPLQR